MKCKTTTIYRHPMMKKGVFEIFLHMAVVCHDSSQVQCLSDTLMRASFHLVGCLITFLFPICGRHSNTTISHRPSNRRYMYMTSYILPLTFCFYSCYICQSHPFTYFVFLLSRRERTNMTLVIGL